MTADAPSPILEADGLSRHFGVRRGLFTRERLVRALDGVTLAVRPDDVLGIVGESGSGKSTLARLMVNLDRPTAGTVRYRGRAVSGLTRRAWKPLRRHLQIVFQDTRSALNPRHAALDQVAEPLAIHAIGAAAERLEAARSVLRRLGLPEPFWRRYPHQLSGGQCQRVVLARAMILKPEVLICDEPTSAADVSVQAQVVDVLQELRRGGGLAIVFISHNLALVRHLCDRVAVMYLGRIVETAPVDALFGAPAHPYTRALVSAVPTLRPGQGAERIYLSGEPPSPIDPPPGCPFHPRCPSARGRCRTVAPMLKPDRHGRLVACHVVHGEA